MVDARTPIPGLSALPIAPPPQPGRPYGLLGLLISTTLMLVGTLAVCGVLALLAFGALALREGSQAALDVVHGFGVRLQNDPELLRQTGVVVSILIYAVLSGLLILLALFRGGPAWRDLIGWHAWRHFRGRSYWALGALALMYALAVDMLLGRYYPPSKDWIVLPEGRGGIALFAILAVVVAPITEELLFRGWILTALRVRIGTAAAILLTAVLFAFAHYERTHLYALAVFPVGLVLGIMRVRADSLLASIAFHAIYNATALGLMLLGAG